jgi:hypothetical protein
VAREGESLVLTNMLGVSIKSLTLADEKGRLYTAENVLEGEKTVLVPTKNRVNTAPNAWRSLVYASANDWATAMKATPGKAEQLLVPRSYLAVVEGSPFLEQGMKGARERPTPSYVLGLMADLQ